ncbi:MAG: prolyl oligopeptidase family serine peptidase [Gammaproteobacteria bacterium]|nr:prolyl oligopeptidase family serine peptidase [Gammaproteobacteria bacterium]
MRRTTLAAIVGGMASLVCGAALGQVDDAHVAAFFGQAPNESPVLAPDGKHFALQRMKEDGVETVDVVRVDNGDIVASFLFKEDVNVFDHGWIDNKTLILRSRMGDPYWEEFPNIGRYHRFDISNNRVDQLFVRQELGVGREDGELRGRFGSYPVRLRYHMFPGSFDARAIIKAETSTEVFQYDMLRESYKSLARLDGNVVDVYTDDAGNVLLAYGKPELRGRTFNPQSFLIYRASGEGEWKTAYEGPFDDAGVSIVGKGPEEDTVYLLETITGDIGALSYIDLNTGEITNAFRPARTDVHTYYLDGKNELYAVRYDDHFPQWHYPNPQHLAAQIHSHLRGQFKNMNVNLTFARDNSKAIVTVSGDANPGTYYLFDTDGNKLSKLFERNEAVANYKLGERHPLEFAGPDDTRIPAYVTLPKGAGQKLPFIVWVHDGLTGGRAATWGWDAEAQFFASLGIGVLNVNHRGKMGFGTKYTKAGFGEWGDYILDDIAEGVRFLSRQGIADPNRICIVGRRWGAYAAMQSALDHRRLYRCAVGIAGMYDMVAIWKFLEPRGARERWEATTVGPTASEDRFKEISPRWRARELRMPVMLLEGRQYRNNIQEQVMDLVRELRAADLAHEFVILDNERTDNWLTDEEKRQGFKALAGFIQANLAPE